MGHLQDEVHRDSVNDPESFWGRQAERLHWHKRPSTVLKRGAKKLKSGNSHETWAWFPGGEISTCYNCLDRHVLAGNGDAPAVFYDSPVTQTKQKLTYHELLGEVEVFAGVLREEGVKRGDVVLLYMPMIPAALIGILATNRLGAIHAVVFGGFAPAALAQRIEASRPAAILTASCGIDGAKPPMGYRQLIEEAIRLSAFKPARTIVWQREQLRWEPLRRAEGERDWNKLVRGARARGVEVDCVPVGSNEGVYIIYTSGTTGLPKGVVREAGGHAVGLRLSISYLFNIHGPGDVMATFSDIGWVVGHSYILYGPLLAGAATVLYEGKPIGTPDASAFWRVVEEYGVGSMFTAPTALRAIRRDDPDGELLGRVGGRGGLRSLRALFLAGERSEPAIVDTFQRLLGRHGAPGARVVDNWWSSESGSPMSGIALAPQSASGTQGSGGGGGGGGSGHAMLQIKPGSAGKPMPGFDVRVVDDEGGEVPRGKMEDEERFYKGYLRRFGAKWLDTGDAGIIDVDGYIHIMSRSDDILNVAGHRLSSGALEQAVTSHPLVAEACVVGIPDALKGQLPFAFVTLHGAGSDPAASPVPDGAVADEIRRLVRSQVGAIASLGGLVQGQGMIPRTRSGKTLRRVLRELVENGVQGEFEKAVAVPSTVEDGAVVDVARRRVREYFEARRGAHRAAEARGEAKL